MWQFLKKPQSHYYLGYIGQTFVGGTPGTKDTTMSDYVEKTSINIFIFHEVMAKRKVFFRIEAETTLLF